MKKVLFCVAALAASVFAQQSPSKLVDGAGAEVQVGAAGLKYDSGMTVLPTTATTVTAANVRVQMIQCVFKTGGTDPSTFTITDNQGTPMEYFPVITVGSSGGNQRVVLVQYGTMGMPFKGIKWSASNTNSVNCQIVGVLQ